MAAQFQLVVHSGPNSGTVYPLEAPEIIIGREPNNLISINDAEVSRKHAKLILQNSFFLIQDLGSTNGTFINGQRITSPVVLKPGDTITLGENVVLLFEAAFDPNATMISSSQVPKAVNPVQQQAPPIAPPATPVLVIPNLPREVFPVQAPVEPVSKPPSPARKKFPIWLIILIVIVVVICVCVGFFLVIDQFSLWCQVLPFLVPLFGGSCA